MSFSPTNPTNWLKWFKEYKETQYGVMVTPENAEGFAAVFASINYICSMITSQPLKAFRKTDDYREEAIGHPYNRKVRGKANEYQLYSQWLFMMIWDMLLWGDGLSLKTYNQRGQLQSYTPWRPEHCEFKMIEGELYVKNFKHKQTVHYDQLIHFSDNFDFESKRGRSRIEIAKSSIKLAMNPESFANEFWNKGTNLSGQLLFPNSLTPEQMFERAEAWKNEYGGSDNAYKVAVVDAGGKFERFNMPMADAQYIEQARFGVEQVARIYNVEPAKIKDHSRSTFSNITELNRSSVTDTLLPIGRYVQDVLNQEFVESYDEEPGRYFVKFNFNALMQGNPEQRAKWIAELMKWGIVDENYVRTLEDMPPVPNARRRVPMNMVPVDREDELIDAKIEDPNHQTDPTPANPDQNQEENV